MRLVFLWIILVLLSTSFVSSWPCKKLNSSVNELKNFNHSYEFPCMYSGLVDIDPSVDANIFYWFFLSPKPDYSTNLVLWFAGGPGGSGEGSIFGENGPLRWRRDSKGTLGIISDIKNSIVDVANVIYVDNPLGVGFSNSQEPITKGEQIGDYIVKFMLKFYELYPEQLNQELIVAGNSYAGHFIPAAAKAIHEYNLHSPSNERKIPLRSLFVEDGYVNPIVQRLSIKDIAFGAGLITPDLLPEYEALEQSCEYAVYNSPSTAFEKCKSMNNLMSATNGGWDLMDIRYASGKGAPRYEDIYDEYFSIEEVQKQLHTLKNGKTIPYAGWNNTCYLNMKYDGIVDYTETYNMLVNAGVKTMVISGAMDGLDGITGTERWVRLLNITEGSLNKNKRKSVYYYLDSNKEEQVGGTYTTFTSADYNIVSLVHVYAGGHVLGITQLNVVKSLLADLISNNEPVCHSKSGRWDIATKIWGYMNSWNKHGMWIENKCQCTHGVAFGADCSIVPEDITSGTLNLHPREWRYLKITKENSGIIVDIKTKEGSQVHVYHKVGNAPARSDFDGVMKAKAMKYVIDKADVHSVIAIHNPSTSYNVTVEINHQALSDEHLISI